MTTPRHRAGSLREWARSVPIAGRALAWAYRKLQAAAGARRPFTGSADYWQERYSRGGDSGVGSYGKFAAFKAEVLNAFVAEHGIRTVIEFGCGDGNQVALADYPKYMGFDVSAAAIGACLARYPGNPARQFRTMDEYRDDRADLALSLDVVYHLVEDSVFDRYMRTLFDAADRYVVVYSSNTDDNSGFEGTHIRHRRFTDWVESNRRDWVLIRNVPNRYPYAGDHRKGSFADFYIFGKR